MANSSVEFVDCRIENNLAEFGGGCKLVNSEALVTQCQLTENTAGNAGGAISGLWGSSIEAALSEIALNEASSGGAVCIRNSSSVILSGCNMSKNSGNNGSGGIDTYGGSIEISGSLISGNSTNRRGGALSLAGGALCDISLTTVFSNEASMSGSFVYLEEFNGMNVSESIIWDEGHDMIGFDGFVSVEISCSVVKGGWEGEGNIDADPLFCDAQGGDYSVADESPCNPDNNDCGVLIGAFPIGCSQATTGLTWTEVKALY